MSKVYQYRKHIQWGQYVIALLFSIIIILWVSIGIWVSVLEQPASEDFSPMILAIMACGTIIFSVEGLLLWYVFYRMAGVRIIIENDSLVYKHRGGETKIDIDKVTKIGLPSIPYVGGWITIIAGDKKIRLTVVVREIGDFIQTLKASLDKIGFADKYNESKLFLFLKTAVYSDQSWERVYLLFWKLIVVTLGSGLLGVGIGRLSGSISFFWIVFTFTLPILIYTGTEIIYGIRIAKSSIRESFFVPPRDLNYEKSVYKVALIVGIIIYLIIALIMVLF